MLAQTPIRSVLSFGLAMQDHALGVLTLYSRSVDAFDVEAIARASVLADQAAIAIEGTIREDRAHNLQRALGVQPPDRHGDRNPGGAAQAHTPAGVRPAPQHQPEQQPQAGGHRRVAGDDRRGAAVRSRTVEAGRVAACASARGVR